MNTLLLLLALSAPAPLPRSVPPTPQITAGSWVLAWGGCEAPMNLDERGYYTWEDSVGWYVGLWRWDGISRTLEVWEWPEGCEDSRIHWTVVLDEQLSGTTSGGVRVQIKRR